MKPEAHKLKPSYSLSRRQLWWSFALSWAVIIAIVGFGLAGQRQAVELASIVIPSMIFLIAGLLGIHRFAGAMDYRASLAPSFATPPYEARDQPASTDSGEVQ